MKPFKDILYVTEDTVDQASALERAVVFAETNQASLSVIDVIPAVDNENRADAINSHKKNLESLVGPYRSRLRIREDVIIGTAFLEVIRAVLRNSHDIVLKPAEKPILMRRLFGSDDMHLLRKCPCPVWLMKPPERQNYHSILAAVGFNPLNPTPLEKALNRQIMEIAAAFALSNSATLHVVHAWEVFAERTMLSRGDFSLESIDAHVEKQHALHQKGLDQLGGALRNRIGDESYDRLCPRFHLPKGPARTVIANLAEELRADLAVMGTVARTGIPGLIIGNTAEAILNQLECSVLAIKPPGFSTPVTL
ncbi:MAG: universal stress protein [Desulfobacterales bacterium]